MTNKSTKIEQKEFDLTIVPTAYLGTEPQK